MWSAQVVEADIHYQTLGSLNLNILLTAPSNVRDSMSNVMLTATFDDDNLR